MPRRVDKRSRGAGSALGVRAAGCVRSGQHGDERLGCVRLHAKAGNKRLRARLHACMRKASVRPWIIAGAWLGVWTAASAGSKGRPWIAGAQAGWSGRASRSALDHGLGGIERTRARKPGGVGPRPGGIERVRARKPGGSAALASGPAATRHLARTRRQVEGSARCSATGSLVAGDGASSGRWKSGEVLGGGRVGGW